MACGSEDLQRHNFFFIQARLPWKDHDQIFNFTSTLRARWPDIVDGKMEY